MHIITHNENFRNYKCAIKGVFSRIFILSMTNTLCVSGKVGSMLIDKLVIFEVLNKSTIFSLS